MRESERKGEGERPRTEREGVGVDIQTDRYILVDRCIDTQIDRPTYKETCESKRKRKYLSTASPVRLRHGRDGYNLLDEPLHYFCSEGE